jgi:hypothetical protein
MALTSKNAAWVRLFMERFDDDFRRQKVLERGTNTQFNLLASMSDEELERWVMQKTRKALGARVAPSDSLQIGTEDATTPSPSDGSSPSE